MDFSIGIKSDPILYRYSYPWLFGFMRRNGLRHMQMGSFFEMYSLDLQYFRDLKKQAEDFDVSITSCFTAHRELGGFFSGSRFLEKAARKNYEKFIDVASVLGAKYVGSNPGAVLRDQTDFKSEGINCYLENMKELMKYAFDKGISGLTIEPMSCTMEPPSLPEEIEYFMETLMEYHYAHDDTVPVYLCGDISHGVRDRHGDLLADNVYLFEKTTKYMSEFHFKNTDKMFDSTFGFSLDNPHRGIVDLEKLYDMIFDGEQLWPVNHVVGYLEIGGPKLGRDYQDCLLEEQLQESVDALKSVFFREERAVVS